MQPEFHWKSLEINHIHDKNVNPNVNNDFSPWNFYSFICSMHTPNRNTKFSISQIQRIIPTTTTHALQTWTWPLHFHRPETNWNCAHTMNNSIECHQTIFMHNDEKWSTNKSRKTIANAHFDSNTQTTSITPTTMNIHSKFHTINGHGTCTECEFKKTLPNPKGFQIYPPPSTPPEPAPPDNNIGPSMMRQFKGNLVSASQSSLDDITCKLWTNEQKKKKKHKKFITQ